MALLTYTMARRAQGFPGSTVVFGFSALVGMFIAGPASSQGREPVFVQGVEDSLSQPSVLILTDGSRFQTTLFEVRLLGALNTVRKKPYLVLAGRGSKECDANMS